MWKQRKTVRPRRGFLRSAGAVGLASVAGCLGGGNDGGSSGETGGATTSGMTIAILAAGSLQNALSNGLEPAVDVPLRIESHGSATVARLIDEGKRDPDIVSVADVALFEEPLSPPWYSEFTSNALVIAYNPDTNGGQQMAQAGEKNWYKPMVNGDVRVGRTDPDQDPLGYRTLFMLELASRYYDDAKDLRTQIPKRKQIYPETSLISRFETGAIDAAIAYRNMAIERGYEYIELPDQIDLSNPKYVEEWYSTVSYTMPNEQEIQGDLISYGSTVRHMSDAALQVFAVYTTGDYLEKHGFFSHDQFPTYTGNVPQRVKQATQSRSGQSMERTRQAALSPAVSDITVLI